MSYELCKRINLDRKNNKIKVTCASNNIRPISYSTYEIFEDIEDFDEKLLNLFMSLQSGDIQISTINDNTEDFEYAMWKVREYLRKNNINSYEDLYIKRKDEYINRLYNFVGFERSTLESEIDRGYEDYKKYEEWKKTKTKDYIKEIEHKFDREVSYEVYGKCFEVFKKALNESFVGDYKILLDNYYPIVKVGKYNRGYEKFSYSYNKETNDFLKVSYKKAYIIMKNLSNSRTELNIIKV